MQCIKQGSTLRVSNKGDKPGPRVVYREGVEDDRIKDFLRFRRRIKDIIICSSSSGLRSAGARVRAF